MAPTSSERKHSLSSGQTGEAHNPIGTFTPLRNETGCTVEVAFANRRSDAVLK